MQELLKFTFLFLIANLFTSTACTPKIISDTVSPDQVINKMDLNNRNELIIQFTELPNIDDWSISYQKYGIQLQKPISKAGKIYLFSFDSDTITGEQALKLFDGDETVKTVELNKKIQAR